MTIDPDQLLELRFEPTFASYGPDDAILYGLGTGAGLDPVDPAQLACLDFAAPHILPSLATVLGYQTFWADNHRCGIDAALALHVSQELIVHRPLPPSGKIRRETSIAGVTDKGARRGALVSVSERIALADSGECIATLNSIVLCRGEGGCGSAGVQLERAGSCPNRPPDLVVQVPTSPQQALIYGLSGDKNPLHVDPAAAARAGFGRPILQGLSTFGAACRVLMSIFCDNRPEPVQAMSARFTGIVYPGDTLRLETWREGVGLARFRLVQADGEGVALDEGFWRYAE